MPLANLAALEAAMRNTEFDNYTDFLAYYIASETNSGESFGDFEDEMRSNPIFKSYADFFLFKIAQVDFSAIGGGGGGSSNFIQAGTGAVTRTAQNKARETVSPEDFGAIGDGVANDTAAIQAAEAYLKSRGGGTLDFKGGSTYKITDTILISSYLKFQGNRSIILMTDNTKPILSFTNEATFIQNSSADNFILRYQTQTATANFVGAVVMGAANKVTWYLQVTRVVIENADTCILLPNESGCNCFLTTFSDICCSTPFGYGIYFYGDSNSSGTNITCSNIWVTGFAAYANNTQGIYFRGVLGLALNHVVFERMKNTVLSIETCVGTASSIYLETLLLGTFGTDRNIIDLINSSFDIQSISTSGNTVSPNNGDIYFVNMQSDFTARNVRIGQIVDIDVSINEGGGFKYFVAKNQSTSGLGKGEIGFYTSGNTAYNPITLAVPISKKFSATLPAAGTITVLKKTPIAGIILQGTASDTVNVGTTASGTDIISGAVLDSNGLFIDNDLRYFATNQTLHISGNANNVEIILPI